MTCLIQLTTGFQLWCTKVNRKLSVFLSHSRPITDRQKKVSISWTVCFCYCCRWGWAWLHNREIDIWLMSDAMNHPQSPSTLTPRTHNCVVSTHTQAMLFVVPIITLTHVFLRPNSHNMIAAMTHVYKETNQNTRWQEIHWGRSSIVSIAVIWGERSSVYSGGPF